MYVPRLAVCEKRLSVFYPLKDVAVAVVVVVVAAAAAAAAVYEAPTIK